MSHADTEQTVSLAQYKRQPVTGTKLVVDGGLTAATR
jgi:hypothetical protein